MSMRWRVRPLALETAIEEGSDHEPFALDPRNDMIYTKEEYFDEGDEVQSSTRHPNLAGNEPDHNQRAT